MSDDPGYGLIVAVMGAAGALVRDSGKLFRPHGLTAAQFNVLNLVGLSATGLSQRELSDELVVDRSNVTGLIDRMEKRGWIRRMDDPKDRRIYRISLTAAGRKLWERMDPLYRDAAKAVTDGLSADQMRKAIDTLDHLTRASARWDRP